MRAQELSDTVSRTYARLRRVQRELFSSDEREANHRSNASPKRRLSDEPETFPMAVVKETRLGSDESSYRVAQSTLMELLENEIDFTSTLPDQCFPTDSLSLLLSGHVRPCSWLLSRHSADARQ